MPELETRWPCPVCLGISMEKAPVGRRGRLVLDHCPRCGGVWFEPGEVQVLRTYRPDVFRARVPAKEVRARAKCHACHAFVDRDADRCVGCGRRTRLSCPSCQRPMRWVRHGELMLDACKRCKGVWFDHHELSAIWELELAAAVDRRRTVTASASQSKTNGPAALIEALSYAPDAVVDGAFVAGQVLTASAEGLAASAEALGGAAEVAGEAAAGVFGAIVEIVGGIFS